MKSLGLLLTAALILAVVGVSMVQARAVTSDEKAAPAEKVVKNLEGTVVSATATSVTVKPHHGDNVTVTTDDKTKVTVDGKAATVADLKEGQKVKVTPATGVATEIAAKSAKEKKAEPKAEPKTEPKTTK